MQELGTSAKGLSQSEAAARLSHYGLNSIAIKKEISPLSLFINQFKNALVLLLLAAALVSLLVGYIDPTKADNFDAFLIFAIVLGNAIFGFIQEYRSEKTIEALTKMSAPKATVLRGDCELKISSESVVPGDIILLSEGDKVPSDARIIDCLSMYVDESMLTGESVPASKNDLTLKEKVVLAERSNMVFMNTIVTRGRGTAVVVATGLVTEVGKIAKDIAEAPEKVTRFQIEIEDIGRKVSIITCIILVVIAITELTIRSGDLLTIFITAVALGVAAIPEGLPAVVTLSLSIATNRMLSKKALMRRLSTVQDLGSINVICTDKTGTLTENAMTVTKMFSSGNVFGVSGKGTDLSGKLLPEADITAQSKTELDLLLKCAILCNDASFSSGTPHFKGDPTEIAVLVPAYKAGLDVEGIRLENKRVGECSFSSERKIMSTANRMHDGKVTVYAKGAPEVILSKCSHYLVDGKVKELTRSDESNIMEQTTLMASHALRVLGFAYKPKTSSSPSFSENDMESDLVFLGLMGMRDPPREGVQKAIEDCRTAGIRVIMVTGDNRYTAESIGRELGFEGVSVTGEELDEMSERELFEVVDRIDIYARTSPRHKVLLLKALKAKNNVVCMTGDGVNDAAAIKNSDVGISMGIRGTEVTKQASDIIVLDDNFVTIRDAISEGRATFDNILKFVTYLLGANISEVLVVFLSTILGLGLPAKLPVQLLWINLVTDGFPALALGVDKPSEGVMLRQPRDKFARMIDSKNLYIILSIGLSVALSLLAVYQYALSTSTVEKAYSLLFTAFVVIEMITVYIVRWRYGTDILSNKWLHISVLISLGLQVFLIYGPFSALFGVVPLGIGEVEELAASIVIYLFLLSCMFYLEQFVLSLFGNKKA